MMDRRPLRQHLTIDGVQPWRWLVVWAGWVLAVRLQQHFAGAADNLFGGHPDSCGHYVTGLLGWNYLMAGLPGHPIEFAKFYYLHYPGVALGQWPPGYALAEALWSLAFSPGVATALWLQAVAMGAAATLACRLLQPVVRWLGAVAAIVLFLVSRPAQVVVNGVMAEPLAIALSLLAVAAYVGYLERPRGSAAFGFGLIAGAALLTKGVAIGLAFLPAAALLSGRAALLRRWHFWAPAGMVLAIAGPWYLALDKLPGWGRGFRFGAERVGGQAMIGEQLHSQLSIKADAALAALGWGLAGLCLVGLVGGVVLPAIRKRLDPLSAVLGVYVVAAVACHFLLRESTEPRHLLHALTPAFGFSFLGARTAIRTVLWRRPRVVAVAALALLGACAIGGLRLVRPPARGMNQAVEAIRADPSLGEAVILVSSQSGGESIFVAELAAREPRPRRVVLRGSKVLARSGWSSRLYALRLESSDEVEAYLDSIPVGVIVLDSMTGNPRIMHHGLLAQALANQPAGWRQIPTGSELVQVFRSTRPDLRQRTTIHVDLTDRIGKVLELAPGTNRPWDR